MRLFTLAVTAVFSLSCGGPRPLSDSLGVLAGTISKEVTGDPVGGITIILKGTRYGALSSKDGFYSISRIPPGNYNVQISGLFYKSATYKSIEVRANRITCLDATLQARPGDSAIILDSGHPPLWLEDES